MALLLPMAAPANASVSQPVAVYPAGWNMVGGPSGTDFGSAGALFAYQSGGYVMISDRLAAPCQGYWAYYFDTRTVPLPADQSTTRSCSLQSGWNLVGNPFDEIVQLPAGTIAYFWNPTTQAYVSASSIQPGAAVWIYSATAATISLSIPSTPINTTTPDVIISSHGGSGPYTVHVGQTIELAGDVSTPSTVTADATYLKLLDAGYQVDLSCAGDPSCDLDSPREFWLWQAIAPGTTAITLDPVCRLATPPCGLPSRSFSLIIVP